MHDEGMNICSYAKPTVGTMSHWRECFLPGAPANMSRIQDHDRDLVVAHLLPTMHDVSGGEDPSQQEDYVRALLRYTVKSLEELGLPAAPFHKYTLQIKRSSSLGLIPLRAPSPTAAGAQQRSASPAFDAYTNQTSVPPASGSKSPVAAPRPDLM